MLWEWVAPIELFVESRSGVLHRNPIASPRPWGLLGNGLTNEEKQAHYLRREHLIDRACVQEIVPPSVRNIAVTRVKRP
jgi:hypothetical protein